MGRMPELAKVVRGTIAMLMFLRVLRSTMAHVAPCEPRWVTTPFFTNREGRNLSHHKSCSNHIIEPHHYNLTSRRMEDQHSQHSTQAELNIIKMEIVVQRLKTAGLSNTTNHKNPILKYEDLGNQLMLAASVY
jgi:hypothetical protein